MPQRLNFYLDDQRSAPAGWQRVKTVDELWHVLERHPHITSVSLDNDLGLNQAEGYDFVKRYIARKLAERQHPEWDSWQIDYWHIHSANIIAADRMRNLLESALRAGVISGALKG